MFITTTYPAQPHTRHCAKTGHFQLFKQCCVMSHFIGKWNQTKGIKTLNSPFLLPPLPPFERPLMTSHERFYVRIKRWEWYKLLSEFRFSAGKKKNSDLGAPTVWHWRNLGLQWETGNYTVGLRVVFRDRQRPCLPLLLAETQTLKFLILRLRFIMLTLFSFKRSVIEGLRNQSMKPFSLPLNTVYFWEKDVFTYIPLPTWLNLYSQSLYI